MPVSVIRAPLGLARRERDAEVGHQRRAVVQQDVLRLDVAVHHPVPVRVVQRARHLVGDPDRVGHRQLLLAGEPVAQRLALDERHDVEQVAVGLARVEQRQDVRVLQVGRELDLGQEPLGADHRRELGPQHLERHPPVVADVLGQVDGRHAAGADLALEAIAVRQGGSGAGRAVRAWGLWLWGTLEDASRRGFGLGGRGSPAGRRSSSHPTPRAPAPPAARSPARSASPSRPAPAPRSPPPTAGP